MTSALATLLKYDLLSIKNWYSTKSVVKLLVSILFLFVFGCIFSLIYLYCFILFQNLSKYDEYGQFVAKYLMVSSVIFLLIFTTLTTTLSSILIAYTKLFNIKRLMLFPINSLIFAFYHFARFFGTSFVSSMVLIFPIFLSYSRVYHFNPVVSLILALCLTLMTQSLGLSLSSCVLRLFGKNKLIVFVLFSALVAISMISSFNFVLPQNFSLLYKSPAESFFALTSTLPVTKSIAYQYLLDPGQRVVSTIVIVTFSLSFTILNVIFQSFFLRHNLVLTSSINTKPSYLSVPLIQSRLPISKKDILYLVRRPQEVLSVLFFLFGGVIITLLIQNLKNIRPFTTSEANTIGLFAFGWFSFFAVSYCLRFILPLLSIEGNNLGVLLLNRRRLFSQKAISAIIFTIPILISSLILWYTFELPIDKPIYIIASLKLICFSAALSFFQGWIYPDFKDSQSPDKVSTSLSGVTVLTVSLIYLFIQYLYLSNNNIWSPAIDIFLITVILIQGLIAKNKVINLD